MKKQIVKIETLSMSEQGKLKGGFSIILPGKDVLAMGVNALACITNTGSCTIKVNGKCETKKPSSFN